MTSLQARLNRDQVLQLPRGGATIEETLTITAGQFVSGFGRASALTWAGDPNTPAVRIEASISNTIYDLTVRDLYVRYGWVSIGRLGDSVTLDGITVMDAEYHGILIDGIGDGQCFRNLRAYSCAGAGVSVITRSRNNNLLFDHLSVAGNNGGGVRLWVEGDAASLTSPVIRHGIIQGNGPNPELLVVGSVTNLTLSACRFERTTPGYAVLLRPNDQGRTARGLVVTDGTVIPAKHVTNSIVGTGLTGDIVIESGCDMGGRPVVATMGTVRRFDVVGAEHA